MRARVALALCVASLGALGASPGARAGIALALRGGVRSAQAVFAGGAMQTQELTLPERRVWALQLGVYDNGERAQAEQERLSAAGMPCVIWQGERMRIVCAAAPKEAQLDADVGMETYAIEDAWAEVSLRVSGAQAQRAAALLALPDELFLALAAPEEEQPLSGVLERARQAARFAAGGESELCAQLTQSLGNWCELIEDARAQWGEQTARRYASLTMATLCRELRTVLLAQASAASTASAQRTPSTAADVIPPA